MIRLLKRVRRKMDQMIMRLRVDREAESETLLDFWRDHGREWATEEASHEDLKFIGELAERTNAMSAQERVAEIQTALKAVWRRGFSDNQDVFGWNDMNDGLPVSALVAFVEGAGGKWADVRDRL